MTKKYVIVDVDNCIADDEWRIPKIRWNTEDKFLRYHDYHLLAAWDSYKPAVDLDIIGRNGIGIILLTARPVMYRTLLVEWCARVGAPFDHLLMRNDNDFRSSTELKRAMLGWLPEYGVERSQIECCYDDRPEVVQMFWQEGLRAEVRAIHDKCAYTDLQGNSHA